MDERGRIVRTLNGERTDLLPWTTRLNMWHTTRVRTGTMPAGMEGLDFNAVHRLLRVGRRGSADLAATRLRGVQMTVEFNGAVVEREAAPTLKFEYGA